MNLNLKALFATTHAALDCDGKRNTTQLSCERNLSLVCTRPARTKAPSPLRSAGAVHDAGGLSNPQCWFVTAFLPVFAKNSLMETMEPIEPMERQVGGGSNDKFKIKNAKLESPHPAPLPSDGRG